MILILLPPLLRYICQCAYSVQEGKKNEEHTKRLEKSSKSREIRRMEKKTKQDKGLFRAFTTQL